MSGTISLLICYTVCQQSICRWTIRRPRYFVLAGSKAPFSLDIGESLTVDCWKKAANDERMLELGPFDMAAPPFYRSTKLDPTIRCTSTNCKIYTQSQGGERTPLDAKLSNDLASLIGKSISSYSFSNVNQENQVLLVTSFPLVVPTFYPPRTPCCECFPNSTLTLLELNQDQK